MNISKKFNKKVRAKLLLIFKKYNIEIKYTKQKTSELYQYKVKTSYITIDDLKTLQKAIEKNNIKEKEVFNNKNKAFINKCINSIVNNTVIDLNKKECNHKQASLFLGHYAQWMTMLKNRNHPMYRFMRLYGRGDLLIGAKLWNKYTEKLNNKIYEYYLKYDTESAMARDLIKHGYKIRFTKRKTKSISKYIQLFKVISLLNARLGSTSNGYILTKNSRDVIRLMKRIHNDI